MRFLFPAFILVFTLISYCKKDISKAMAKSSDKQLQQIKRETIHFPSKDKLLITADDYPIIPAGNYALLCHQARFSRGEYRETAPLLALKGFHCLAIDQRSGNRVKGVINQTAKRAREKELPTNYLDARQDIEAAIDHAYKENNNKPILLVGSSYSASLSLLIGNKNPKVKAIAVFSPGEYFKGYTIADSIKDIQKPIFITSAKNELKGIKELVKNVDNKYITLFEPKTAGFHGSKALWKENKGHEAYRNAFNDWLKTKL